MKLSIAWIYNEQQTESHTTSASYEYICEKNPRKCIILRNAPIVKVAANRTWKFRHKRRLPVVSFQATEVGGASSTIRILKNHKSTAVSQNPEKRR